MMWYLCLFLFLQEAQTPTAVAQQPTTQPSTAPAGEAPLVVELINVTEHRMRGKDDKGNPLVPDLRFRMRLSGPRFQKIVRLGRPVLDEVVDDTGKQLVDPEKIKDQRRDDTRVVMKSHLLQGSLELRAMAQAAARQAAKLKIVRGTVRVVLHSAPPEEITINDPLRFRGKAVEHPRLKELGIEVKMLPLGDPAGVPETNSAVSLSYGEKEILVHDIAFYDEWMQKISIRGTLARSNAGDRVVVYQATRAEFTEDTQMVLTVHPKVRDLRVPIKFKDVELP